MEAQLDEDNFSYYRGPYIIDKIVFPPSTGICINMMPFILGDLSTLPSEYHGYIPIISKCMGHNLRERGKIGYLTIQESDVPANSTQRRPGLHTDAIQNPDFDNDLEVKGAGGNFCAAWGGGIYLASNIANSCMVWNREVSIPGVLGDCENLREELGSGHLIDANHLVWISDTTPHEALPVDRPVHRQFFRLVGHELSRWYEGDNTPNPLGVAPDCLIVEGSKLGGDLSLK